MRVFAVSMMRNEVDVAEAVCRHLLAEGVEAILVADHASTDGTPEALAGIEGVEVEHLDGAGYPQAETMTHLTQQARERGATWVIPFDADEVWYAPGGRLVDVLGSVPKEIRALEAVVWEQVPQPTDDPALHAFEAMVWRRPEPWGWIKVAFRPRGDTRVWMGNHGIHPFVTPRPGWVEARHYPYRTLAQSLRKIAWKGNVMAGLDTGLQITPEDPQALAWWAKVTDPEGLILDPPPVKLQESTIIPG